MIVIRLEGVDLVSMTSLAEAEVSAYSVGRERGIAHVELHYRPCLTHERSLEWLGELANLRAFGKRSSESVAISPGKAAFTRKTVTVSTVADTTNPAVPTTKGSPK
jgi:hypothetical protein